MVKLNYKMTLTNPKDEFDIVEFLKRNPDLFQRQPELLELVTLSDARGTSSLLERQIDVLKERLQAYQSQQFELIDIARENEQISDSFSNIVCQLIGYRNLSEFAGEFPLALRRTFSIDEVSFKTASAVQQRPDDKKSFDDALRRLSNKQAMCDNRWPNSIIALFFSPKIKSAALIPMLDAEQTILGILALGSSEADRYTHDLGTAHLDRLGVMAGICLSRLQPVE